jgi:small subunit ribosomal protein S15
MVTKETKANLVKKFGGTEKNSGKAEVQIALITERINSLTDHFKNHKKDFSGMRGMMKLVGQRKSLLKNLQMADDKRYQDVIKELGLRK